MKQLTNMMKPLTGLVLFGSLLALAACGGEQQQQQQQAAAPAETQAEKEVIVWKLAQTWGTGFPIFGDAVIKMADLVKEMSGGELEIRIDSANKHKAAFGVLDMVKAGKKIRVAAPMKGTSDLPDDGRTRVPGGRAKG